MNCKWTIHMQIPSDRIQLRVVDFAVQANADSDYLIVYDGKEEENDQILGTFYGNHVPPSKLESKSNWMTIVFHSDDSFSEKGFNFTYQRKGMSEEYKILLKRGKNILLVNTFLKIIFIDLHVHVCMVPLNSWKMWVFFVMFRTLSFKPIILWEWWNWLLWC